MIKDFADGNDRIHLYLPDVVRPTSADDAFVFIGAKPFSGVAGDVDGNKIADFQVELSGLPSWMRKTLPTDPGAVPATVDFSAGYGRIPVQQFRGVS